MARSDASSFLAIDLTTAGAPRAWQRDRDPQTEEFITARLAGLAKLIDDAGADLITVGSPFRLGGRRKRDDYLDGAVTLSRIGSHTDSVRLAAAIPLNEAGPKTVHTTLAALNSATGDRGGWLVDNRSPATALEVVAQSVNRSLPGTSVVIDIDDDADIDVAAAYAQVARLRVATVEEARNLRSEIKNKAERFGRSAEDIDVIIDARVVLAQDVTDAQNRADFIAELTQNQPANLLQHVGTPRTLATVWHNWVRAGAADGFTLIPASIPTDVVAIASGLIDQLQQRGLRNANAPALEVQTIGATAGEVVAA